MAKKKSPIQADRTAKRRSKSLAAGRSQTAQPSKQRTRFSSRTESMDVQGSPTGRPQAGNQPEPALQKSKQRFRQKGSKLLELRGASVNVRLS